MTIKLNRYWEQWRIANVKHSADTLKARKLLRGPCTVQVRNYAEDLELDALNAAQVSRREYADAIADYVGDVAALGINFATGETETRNSCRRAIPIREVLGDY
jgi:hypothetical protein